MSVLNRTLELYAGTSMQRRFVKTNGVEWGDNETMKYLLKDSNNTTVAEGTIEKSTDKKTMEMVVSDEDTAVAAGDYRLYVTKEDTSDDRITEMIAVYKIRISEW